MDNLLPALPQLSIAQVVAGATVFFALLYFGGALVTCMLIALAKRLGLGRVLDVRALRAGQLRREIGQSLVSILIFGIGALLPWWLLRNGHAHLAPAPSAGRIVLEIIALFFWNELHFYLCHRLLHTRALRRFHVDHHRSVTPTPFSTYAFHPIEALLLGSVPIVPMLLHDFSLAALLTLPVMSIALNNLGHANYEFSPQPHPRGPLAASRRHQLHHARYHGNYGFLLALFDRLGGTVIADSASLDNKV